MLKRLLLASVLLFSYAGAIVHSVVPHHHHHSQQEAKDHHHDRHDHQAKHSHDAQQDQDNHQKDATYLLAHSANADVLVNHTSIDGALKGKKTEIQAILFEFSILDQPDVEQVFHAPPNDHLATSTASPFPALRAPPVSIV